MRKPCNTLLFLEYEIQCAMLKNAMLFILAVFSLSGCVNYGRPKNVAVKNSISNYPPPYRFSGGRFHRAEFKPNRNERFRKFLGAP